MTRHELLETLALLGSRERQWSYERNVPIANVPAELFESFSDLAPDDVPERERPIVMGFVDLLHALAPRIRYRDLIDMQKQPEWTLIESAAAQTLRAIAPEWKPSPVEEPTPPNPAGTWAEYFDSMRDKPVHPLYRELDRFLPSAGAALELASGVGQGALYLLRRGLEVWAWDARGEALVALDRSCPREMRDRLHLAVRSFERMALPTAGFDVVVAGFCLFFMPPELLTERWPQIVAAIKPGGLFMGQFLGVRDDWAAMGYTAQTREELDGMLSGFEILHLEEAEREGATAQGTPKRWHVYHVIAKRLGPLASAGEKEPH